MMISHNNSKPSSEGCMGGKTVEYMSNDFQGEVVLYITPQGGYVHAVSV